MALACACRLSVASTALLHAVHTVRTWMRSMRFSFVSPGRDNVSVHDARTSSLLSPRCRHTASVVKPSSARPAASIGDTLYWSMSNHRTFCVNYPTLCMMTSFVYALPLNAISAMSLL